MKKISWILVLFLSITPSFSQKTTKVKGTKIVTHTVKDIAAFNTVEVSGSLEIFLVSADKPTIEIEADDNLHDAVSHTIAGGTLRLSLTKQISSAKRFIVRVNYTNSLSLVIGKDNAKINALNELQAPNVTVKNFDKSMSFLNVNTQNFTLILTDKSLAEINVKAQSTTLELSKTAELKALVASPSTKIDMYERSAARIEGDAATAKIRLDNSTNLTAKKFTVKNLNISVENYAKGSVTATENISISAAGKTEIELYGQPEIEITRFANSTTLHKKEL